MIPVSSRTVTSIPGPARSNAYTAVERAADGLRTAAFWATVLLPALYVPVLYGGIAGQRTGIALLLLALNAVCALIGHDHTP